METITIATVLILLITLPFYINMRKNSKDAFEESGISLNYKTLINELLSQDKTAYIEKAKVNSVNIRTSGAKDAPVFSLTEVQSRIIIVWTWSAAGFGRRGKEWSFPDSYDQEKIYEEIQEDIVNYQISVYHKHNQRMSVRPA
jgi:hypothetical protein